ncbi:NBR1-Ig-like domain-containing protein [Amycolatopsis sp. NPDC059657]|uniref:NBR1-Ig-like domain-containing protein n=1 Tax=Amycolatopsis sp. NPDC059657 TaxID=3346899 RepID=UPI00366DF3D5
MTTLDNPATTLAAELARLRREAGDPSFRKMAERSGRISHTTLHEAVRGTRFPSWETTREFAKACGADEEHWRRRWVELQTVPEPDVVDEVAAVEPARRRPVAWAFAAVVILILAAVAIFAVPSSTPPVDTGARFPGDESVFVADVTVPDGTVLRPGQSVLKVWEIQNAGTVYWHNRYLQRMDLPAAPEGCQTPDRVPIGDTAPGEHVMISVMVRAQQAPGRCWIGWKMVDDKGVQFFATRRPVFLLVEIAP